MYLGSAGLVIGGGVAGVAICLLATQMFKKAMWHWNYAQFLDKQALDASLCSSKDFTRIDSKDN